jgi:hypothetical protein
MAARTAGRKGRPHRRAKQQLRTNHGDLCHLCGHPGAGELDHDPPRWLLIKLGLDPNNPRYHKPAHGSSCPCPYCPRDRRGRRRSCNQKKGGRIRAAPQRTSTAW